MIALRRINGRIPWIRLRIVRIGRQRPKLDQPGFALALDEVSGDGKIAQPFTRFCRFKNGVNKRQHRCGRAERHGKLHTLIRRDVA